MDSGTRQELRTADPSLHSLRHGQSWVSGVHHNLTFHASFPSHSTPGSSTEPPARPRDDRQAEAELTGGLPGH